MDATINEDGQTLVDKNSDSGKSSYLISPKISVRFHHRAETVLLYGANFSMKFHENVSGKHYFYQSVCSIG